MISLINHDSRANRSLGRTGFGSKSWSNLIKFTQIIYWIMNHLIKITEYNSCFGDETWWNHHPGWGRWQEKHGSHLVGGWAQPLWKIMEWARQLGWWHSQYDGKVIKFIVTFPTEWKVIKFHGSKSPTSNFRDDGDGHNNTLQMWKEPPASKILVPHLKASNDVVCHSSNLQPDWWADRYGGCSGVSVICSHVPFVLGKIRQCWSKN